MDTIENKIANSSLTNFDLESLYDATPCFELDIKSWLWQEMVVREKEFKDFLNAHDWSQYNSSYVCFYCSCDAIIPNWAWMLVAEKLQGNCDRYFKGIKGTFRELLFSESIAALNIEEFKDQRVLVKGCGDKEVPSSAYVMLSQKLMPVVKSLMFGEACSNVPIYKKK